MPMTSVRMRSLLRPHSNPNTPAEERATVAGSAAGSAAGAPAPAPVQYSFIVARQDWDAVREMLSTEEGVLSARAEMEDSPNVDGALHFTCRFHPPLDVVAIVSGSFPDSVRLADNMGRYALHIAAKWGASPKVIKFLLAEHPDAAGFQDAMGKTPLHLCCESYADKYSSRKAEGRTLKESMVEVVRALCRAAPDSVNLEDMDDMTALEYAIEADLELKVVRSIQKACEKDWKHRREGEGKTHEAVERSILQQQQQNSQRLRSALLESQRHSSRRLLSAVAPGPGDVSDATSRMALAKLSDEVEPAGTRPTIPLQHQPRKKPSTRALMA